MTKHATTLITLDGPGGSKDLAAPADAPVAELLPTFVELVTDDAADASSYELGFTGRPALDGHRSLADHGVVDGGRLELRPVRGAATPVEAASRPEPAPIVDDAGGPLARTAQVMPRRLGTWERLGEAWGAAVNRVEPAPLPPTVRPGRTDPASLTKPVKTTAADRWRRNWRSTDYLRRLDDAIREPKLRRCATIAVVSPKGGVGKTTLTALLGSLLAQDRRDRAVAVDTNPDYGSLGRTLAPDHEVFVDDLLDLLERPGLTTTELDAQLGRARDGLMVLPAPTDPARMARLDRQAYATVIERLQALAGLLILDCGTGLQEPAAQAAMHAADQIVLVSDAEPSTASLVAEASTLLERSGAPITLVVNKLPRKGSRLDIKAFESHVPRARGLVEVPFDPPRASRVASGEFSWTEPAPGWDRAVRELAVVLTADWERLGLTA